VFWVPSEVEWASRWDIYLNMGNRFPDKIHWFSIVNSVVIVVFLTGMIAMILVRALHRDISRYNRVATDEEKAEDREETGWKLVYGDVFRPPSHEMMLSVLVGSGVQVIGMATALMVFALLGFVSPANRGGLLTLLLILFSFMGYLAGFYGQKLYTLFQGKKWTLQTILTAVFFPGSLFFLFILINLSVFSEGSSSAMSFSTFFILMLLWFGISTPLVFLGSYFGKKEHNQIEVPVPVKQIHRVIPDQVWYTHPLFSILLGGILPFGAVCIELFFIMSALWLDQIYYVFGFLFIVLLILVITSAEITIVMCYFQLCSEDYRWWWRSFYTSGSAGLYLFAYAIWYFVSKLDMQHTSSIFVYFSYMAMISMAFSLFCGTVGFFSSLWFVKKIYAAIKID
jgi:transmembrane 9 superfamily protein 2/4